MTASLKEFRDLYPAAIMIGELLAVQGDLFVVKVTIETQGSGTASGMAADADLEIAEDRARQRALQGFGIWEGQTEPFPISGGAIAAGDYRNQEKVETKTTVHQSAASPETRTLPETGIPAGESPKPLASANAKPQVAPQASLSQPSSPQSKAPQPHAPQSSEKPTAASTLPQPPPADLAASSLPLSNPSSDDVLPPPVNLSDVIAQTDVELRRLGWSVAAGREYLESAYSKRSRHDLTDEELLAFLLHLESLPTPQKPE